MRRCTWLSADSQWCRRRLSGRAACAGSGCGCAAASVVRAAGSRNGASVEGVSPCGAMSGAPAEVRRAAAAAAVLRCLADARRHRSGAVAAAALQEDIEQEDEDARTAISAALGAASERGSIPADVAVAAAADVLRLSASGPQVDDSCGGRAPVVPDAPLPPGALCVVLLRAGGLILPAGGAAPRCPALLLDVARQVLRDAAAAAAAAVDRAAAPPCGIWGRAQVGDVVGLLEGAIRGGVDASREAAVATRLLLREGCDHLRVREERCVTDALMRLHELRRWAVEEEEEGKGEVAALARAASSLDQETALRAAALLSRAAELQGPMAQRRPRVVRELLQEAAAAVCLPANSGSDSSCVSRGLLAGLDAIAAAITTGALPRRSPEAPLIARALLTLAEGTRLLPRDAPAAHPGLTFADAVAIASAHRALLRVVGGAAAAADGAGSGRDSVALWAAALRAATAALTGAGAVAAPHPSADGGRPQLVLSAAVAAEPFLALGHAREMSADARGAASLGFWCRLRSAGLQAPLPAGATAAAMRAVMLRQPPSREGAVPTVWALPCWRNALLWATAAGTDGLLPQLKPAALQCVAAAGCVDEVLAIGGAPGYVLACLARDESASGWRCAVELVGRLRAPNDDHARALAKILLNAGFCWDAPHGSGAHVPPSFAGTLQRVRRALERRHGRRPTRDGTSE